MSNQILQLKFNNLVSVLKAQDISYNEEAKEEFKRKGLLALRALAKELGFSESKADFNAGGIAVSGDLNLYGMWPNGKGVVVYISQHAYDGDPVSFFYRSITSLKDYKGGSNQWVKGYQLSHMEDIVNLLKNA